MAKSKEYRLLIRSNPPVYMNAEEAAIYLNVSKSHFLRELAPLVDKVKLGGRVNYKRDVLDELVAELTSKAV